MCSSRRIETRLAANLDRALPRGQMVRGNGQACAISYQCLAVALQTNQRLAVANIRFQVGAIKPQRLLSRSERLFVAPQHPQHHTALNVPNGRLRFFVHGLIQSVQRQIRLAHEPIHHAQIHEHRRGVWRFTQGEVKRQDRLLMATGLRQ